MDSSYMHLPNNSEDYDNENNDTVQQHEENEDSDTSDEKTPLIQHNNSINTHSHAHSRKICPTCHGKGKLSQSDADKVVALIPAGDKRLKPRRTELYLTLTAIFCIVSGCALVFFLWPRAIYVHVVHARSINIHIADLNDTFIEIETRLHIENENFFAANITNIDVTVTWNQVYNTCNTTVRDFRPVVVERGAPQNVTFVLRQSFMVAAARSLHKTCDCGWKWSILEYFDFSLKVSMKFHRDQVVRKTHWSRVLCYNATSFTDQNALQL